ncbi:hypothetical protein BGX27_008347 [Mortierella sp. AM989]|nr:hypothetical protein BGX27_008347 [Mortierella sp. AM989]
MKFTFLVSMAVMVATASAQFVAYSKPYFHGSKQTFKETPGCYSLNGKDVASFKGVSNALYILYADSGCGGNLLFNSTSAPIKKISPAIKPRSLKILNAGSSSKKTSLVVYSRSHYAGSRQTVKGTGCLPLSGQKVSSFKGYGGYRYKFYPDATCTSAPLLQSKGGDKSNTRTIKPQSVYIYKN